jgi:hypothetical protein
LFATFGYFIFFLFNVIASLIADNIQQDSNSSTTQKLLAF